MTDHDPSLPSPQAVGEGLGKRRQEGLTEVVVLGRPVSGVKTRVRVRGGRCWNTVSLSSSLGGQNMINRVRNTVLAKRRSGKTITRQKHGL